MQEGLSLAGMAEVPVLCVLSMRSGPSTGVPTYTEQGDLRFALNQGHGEFARVVAAPGSVEEAFHLTAEMLGLVWKYQTVGIIVSDKHLSECSKTVVLNPEKALWSEYDAFDGGDYRRYMNTESGVSPLLFPPSREVIKWTSYEHDEFGIATESPEDVVTMHDKRKRKGESLIRELKGMKTVNVFGEGDQTIFTYGSTTMSVLEALRISDLSAKIVQPIYLEPFPDWDLREYSGGISVEQSCDGQFTSLLKEKANIEVERSIRKYDGRPFDPVDLERELREVV